MGIRLALIIAILTLVSYWHLFKVLENSKLSEIQTYTAERGARESEIFSLAEDNHKLLKAELETLYLSADREKNILLFDDIAERQSDGAYRSSASSFDGESSAGIWVSNQTKLTDDIKNRIVIFQQLNTEFGKSWQNRFMNTYILGPENFATSYWPNIPDFVYRLGGDFDIREEQYFAISSETNNPSRKTVWTGLYWDQQAKLWMASIETPVYIDDRHIATIGNDISLTELFSRTLKQDDRGYKLIFQPDGRLVASTQYLSEIKANSGQFKIHDDGDETLQTIYQAVINSRNQVGIKLEELDLYLFVTELKGPGWLYVFVVPTSILTEIAKSTAAIVLFIGLLGLLVELLILFSIMKKKIALPLVELTKATISFAKISNVNQVQLNSSRSDELGRLARSFILMKKRLHERDRELIQNQQKFQNAFDHSPIGMAIVAMDGKILEVNDRFILSVGFSQSELQKMKYTDLLDKEAQVSSKEKQTDILQGKLESYEAERLFKAKSGKLFWCLISVSVQLDESGRPDYAFIQSVNIDQRKLAEDELNRLAYHDPLTSLTNRTMFTEFLENSIQRYQRDVKNCFAVLFIDLDGFKLVNDSMGHIAGDSLLKAISVRLQKYVRDSDVLARFGGDEFCILVQHYEREQEVVDIAGRINKALSSPFIIESESVTISASIGVVISTESTMTAEDYLRNSDNAMYYSKQKGRGSYALFNDAMQSNARQKLILQGELAQAIEKSELVVFYQPLINTRSNQIKGFESLVRWSHPKLGLLSPDQFLPIAEAIGIVDRLDLWVFESAIAQLKEWQFKSGNKALTMNCNASSDLVSDSDSVAKIKSIIEVHELDPKCVNLEVTETVLIQDKEKTKSILSKLSLIGIGIHLDDFGTGYSSLNYLTQFPINTLKIDRSFVQRVSESEKDLAIIESIQLMANRLGIDVTAEGIESIEQFNTLASIGVGTTQGYFHGKPGPKEEWLERLLNNARV